MLHNLLTLATCLSVAAALPAAAPELVERQTAPKGYGNNGTIVDAPPETDLSRPNFAYTADQLNQIKLAPTTGQKMAILKNLSSADDIFKFDLTPAGSKSNAGNGLGGVAFLAEASGFPVLMGTGISVAIGYLNPCGLDSIHLHNRATELVTLVKGTSLKAGFVMEDGFDLPVQVEIGLYQTAVRPLGSLHWEFNDNCDPAVFVASLSHEDPGVSRTGQNFFIAPSRIINANLAYPAFLDGVNTTDFRASLPAAFAQGAKECYTRCGLTYNPDQAGGITK